VPLLGLCLLVRDGGLLAKSWKTVFLRCRSLLLERSYVGSALVSFGGLGAATLIYLGLRHFVIGSILGGKRLIPFYENPLIELGAFERALGGMALLGKYLVLSVVPYKFSIDYTFPRLAEFYSGLTLGFPWLYLALSLAFLFSAVFMGGAYRFGVFWFFGASAVTSNILFATGTIFAERLAFAPSLGICVCIASLIGRSSKLIASQLLTGLLIFIFSAVFILNFDRWKDNVAAIQYELNTEPVGVRSLVAYGALNTAAGRFDKAEVAYKKAEQLVPSFYKALDGLGHLELKRKNYQKAESYFQEVVDSGFVTPTAMKGLAFALYEQGQLDKAGELFSKVLNSNNEIYEREQKAAR